MDGSPGDALAGAAAAWFRDRRRAGPPDDEAGWRRAETGGLGQNVVVRVWVACEGGRVRAVRYQVFGGPGALACAAWMAARLEGQTASAESVPAGREAVAALELTAEATGDALMVEDALREALAMDPRSMKP